jgi:type III secretion system FlhB-like substrate exporter
MNRMPDTLSDTVLSRAGLEPIERADLPRIVSEGGGNIGLRFFHEGRDHEIRLSRNDLANLLLDGLAIYVRAGR